MRHLSTVKEDDESKIKGLKALSAGKVGFIEPMYAKPVTELSERSEWQYEIKFDGHRCLARQN